MLLIWLFQYTLRKKGTKAVTSNMYFRC